ncbi:MAG: hypothetical protein HZB51_12720 [Chloroflexi bacterium]|nr:hypothetical protein [Chloroflexota bacterium]
MKKFFALGLSALVAILATTASVQASPRDTFYMEKVCLSVIAPDLNACDIVTADSFGQLVGGLIIYNDRVWIPANPAGFTFEIARIQVTTGDNSGTATGQVRWLKDHGLFTISQGTGSLAGLHVNAVVQYVGETADGRWLYSVSGTYHVDP